MDRMIRFFSFIVMGLFTTLGSGELVSENPAGRGGFQLFHRLPEHFPFRDRLVETSEAYTLFAKSKKSLLYTFLLSFPVLFSFYGAFYCTGRALGAGVSMLDMFSIMPIVTSIISLPITPSGIGFRESLLGILLNDLCNVPTEIGVLISLLGFAYFVLFGVAGGVTYLFYAPKKHSRWREMQDEVRRAHGYSD